MSVKTIARLVARTIAPAPWKPGTKWFRFAGSDVWHFHPSCHHMARSMKALKFYSGFRRTKPRSGDLCNECKAKARADKRTQANRKGLT